MTNGNISTRKLERLCINDIRFRWLLRNELSFPSHMTIDNFMNNYLKDNIENIFKEINKVIFEKDKVDLTHILQLLILINTLLIWIVLFP